MKRFLGGFLPLLLFVAPAYAQLAVDINPPNDDPQHLVQNVLLGNGVAASNITFSGDPDQIGFFDGTSSNIGIGSGLIMATGSVTQATGPNSSGSISTGGGNFGASDPDLATLSGFGINDAAILEFDFVPSGDSVAFRYVFASDEYNEFACSGFNDVFGFFISGPGFAGPFANGAENIALVPGTTTPVAINTVNLGVAGSSGAPANCDAADPNWATYNVYFTDNTGGQTVEYDGFTVVLEAFALVQCNQTYHIKLAIGDAGDTGYDSGVFLEAESFSSSDVQVSLSFATGNLASDSTIVEGCTDAVFEISRSDTSLADTVNFTITGSAINGVDYLPLDSVVILPPGDSVQQFVITPILDTLTEGTDTLTISLIRINECGDTITQSVSLYIIDDYTIATTPIDTSVGCPGDSVPVLVDVFNYIDPLTFAWSTGDTLGSADTLWVTPTDTMETFYVTIWDSCMNSIVTDSVLIEIVLDTPTVMVPDTFTNCPGAPLVLQAFGDGGSGNGYSYVWSNGSTSDTAQVSPIDSTWYSVTITDNCTGLTGEDSVLVTIVLQPPVIGTSGNVQLGCVQPTTITVSVLQGSGDYDYAWSNGSVSDTAVVQPAVTTTYTVTVTDNCSGMSAVDSVEIIMIINAPQMTLTDDLSTLCPGDNANLFATAFGGAGQPYTYSWSTGQTTSNISVAPMTTTTYSVTVGDACGVLTVFDSVTVTVGNPPNLGAVLLDSSIFCPGDPITLTVVASLGQPPYAYSWSNGTTNPSLTVAPTTTTTYSVTVTDGCNQTNVQTSEVTVPNYPPIDFSDENTDVLCAGDPVQLAPAVSGGAGSPYTYLWTSEGDTLGTDSTISDNPSTSQTYRVRVTDPCGTIDSIDYTISVPQWGPIVLTLSDDSVIVCENDSVFVFYNASGGTGVYTAAWTSSGLGITDSTSYSYLPTQSEWVSVTIEDQCDEVAFGDIWVEVEDCSVRGVNVITPNNDGINDVLVFPNNERHENSHLIVFNRWGGKVYESNNYKDDWNGGNEQPGTYYYVLTTEDGQEVTGFVTILGER